LANRPIVAARRGVSIFSTIGQVPSCQLLPASGHCSSAARQRDVSNMSRPTSACGGEELGDEIGRAGRSHTSVIRSFAGAAAHRGLALDSGKRAWRSRATNGSLEIRQTIGALGAVRPFISPRVGLTSSRRNCPASRAGGGRAQLPPCRLASAINCHRNGDRLRLQYESDVNMSKRSLARPNSSMSSPPNDIAHW